MNILDQFNAILSSKKFEEEKKDGKETININSFVNYEEKIKNKIKEIRTELQKEVKLKTVIKETETSFYEHLNKLKSLEDFLYFYNKSLIELTNNLTELKNKIEKVSKVSNQNQIINKKLEIILKEAVLPKNIFFSIINNKIDSKWKKNVEFIENKLEFIENIKNKKSFSDVSNLMFESKILDELDKQTQTLFYKIMERIRDHFIFEIKLLRQPSITSSQKIQIRMILIKELYFCLQKHHSELAFDLQNAYIDSIKWYYRVNFSKYIFSISKLHLHKIDHNFVIGNKNSIMNTGKTDLKNWFLKGSTQRNFIKTSSSSPVSLNDYLFSVYQRLNDFEEIRSNNSYTTIPSQIAESTPFYYWIEFIYCQWLFCFVDNIIAEKIFFKQLFLDGLANLNSNQIDNDINKTCDQFLNVIFNKVFILGVDFLKCLLFGNADENHSKEKKKKKFENYTKNYDAYGLLILICLIDDLKLLLNNSFSIFSFNVQLEYIYLILKQEFINIIKVNCDSISEIELDYNEDYNLAPLNVTQQFAQFLLGLLKFIPFLKKNNQISSLLIDSVNNLIDNFEEFMNRLSKKISHDKLIQKKVFLYNNYFLTVNILKDIDNDLLIGFHKKKVDHFENLCKINGEY